MTKPGLGATKLVTNGPDSSRIVLVFIGDGYTQGEQQKFDRDVDSIIGKFFQYEPWHTYKSFVNIYKINAISNESGTDYSGVLKDTKFSGGVVLGSGYASAGVDASKVRQAVDAEIAKWDAILTVINFGVAAGSGIDGMAVLTASGDMHSTALHEMGHSLIGPTGSPGLADEYGGSEGMPSAPEPNIAVPPDTAREGPHAVKWAKWLTPGIPIPTPESGIYFDGVGLFQGAKYSPSAFRPEFTCTMGNAQSPFCRICVEALTLKIKEYVNSVESSVPPAGVALYGVYDTRYEVALLDTANINYRISWVFDYQPVVNEHGTSVTLHPWDLGQSPHVLKAIVTDTTRYGNFRNPMPPYGYASAPFVRNDPLGLMSDTVTWYLQFSPDARIVAVAPAPNSNRSFAFAGNRFQVGAGSGDFTMHIYDMRGRLLQAFTGGRAAVNLPWHNPSSGAYVIRLNSGSTSQTQKIAIR